MIKTIGSSSDHFQIEKLVIEAEQWIKEKKGLLELDLFDTRPHINQFFNNIEQITGQGIEHLSGKNKNNSLYSLDFKQDQLADPSWCLTSQNDHSHIAVFF